MKKFLVLLLTIPSPLFAQDTFSICAVDTVTGEVGSAGASCIDAIMIGNSIGCALISDVHPGVGVIHTQAYYISPNQSYAASLMNLGLSPQQIMDSVQVNDYQNNPSIRQYGAAKLNGSSALAAAFTGSGCTAYASHRVGPNYAIQGNILLGAQILDSMEARFLNTPGDLACKLMSAMQGANVVGADTRCMNSGNSSLSSFLKVADSTGFTIDLVVPYGPTGFEPLDSLQVLFDNVHTCVTGIHEHAGVFTVSVFPNPSADDFRISLSRPLQEESIFELYDNQGKLVMKHSIDKQEMLFSRKNLAGGIYYYRVLAASDKIAAGKIIFE